MMAELRRCKEKGTFSEEMQILITEQYISSMVTYILVVKHNVERLLGDTGRMASI